MKKTTINLNHWPYPFWIAHRGGGTLAPENTLEGFQTGVQQAIKMVEFDVKLSADKVSFLLHDDGFLRTAKVNKNAHDLTFSEIQKINVSRVLTDYPPTFPPSFQQIAEFCLQHKLAVNIEIKPSPNRDQETARQVAQEALKFWENSTLPPLFSSFSIPALEVLAKEFPNCIRSLLIEEWEDCDKLIQQLNDLNCVSLNVPDLGTTQERIQAIHNAGFAVLVWTVNDMQRAKQLKEWGVQGLFTDRIDLIF